jgi:hypothetical protein
MALAIAVLVFIAVSGFCLALASLGNLILRYVRLEMDTDQEHLLVAVAIGLVVIEIALFAVQATQHVRQGCYAVLILLATAFSVECKTVLKAAFDLIKKLVSQSKTCLYLLSLLSLIVLAEFLTAVAPLAGSDALHYHFTTQVLILERGFHPIFSISHSFLCGQSHLLILFGLALGSERLALGSIFLGGVLTAFSLACLAARWASCLNTTAITVLFLLTPVVFWQISSSGSPDIWMGFLTCTTVIVLRQTGNAGTRKQALLAGLLAGGIAGAKYTGCIMAVSLAVATVFEFRSAVCASLFVAGSFISGLWPYLRNFAWTGDPVFPFYSRLLSPGLVNEHALMSLLADTGASRSRDFGELLPFLFFAGIQPNNIGFWDFFGPIIFALGPLVLLAFKSSKDLRLPATVWLVFAFVIFFASSLPRLELPAFPLALVCAAAGTSLAETKNWAVTRKLALGSIALMSIIGGLAFIIYSREPLRTTLGMKEKAKYLEQSAPDYQVAEAVNRLLANRAHDGKALVFFRHLYYLRIPFVNGDPDSSWSANPDILRTRQQWKAFLSREKIRYVVKSPNYPSTFAEALEEMEKNGDLVPLAETVVQNISGMRIKGDRVPTHVLIFRVSD